MLSEIMQLCISNGLWAVLFVFLFLYQIKTNGKREEQYMSVIDSLTESVGVIKNCGQKLDLINSNITQMKKMYLKKANG